MHLQTRLRPIETVRRSNLAMAEKARFAPGVSRLPINYTHHPIVGKIAIFETVTDWHHSHAAGEPVPAVDLTGSENLAPYVWRMCALSLLVSCTRPRLFHVGSCATSRGGEFQSEVR
jgi:hypothetical protein